MPRVVPSQVVSLINNIFPGIPEGLDYTHAPYLRAVLDLLDQISPELITLDEDDYTKYVGSVSVLRSSIISWETRGNVRSPIDLPGHGNSIRLILQCLKKCPDEGIEASTVKLTFISDPDFEEILRKDISASNQALFNGEWKAATVLAGATVEALLLWALQQEISADIKAAIDNLVSSSALSRIPDKDLEKWTLDPLIEVSKEIKLIKSVTADQARLAKDFRNLIHPGRANRLGQVCDRGTALSAVAAVEHVVRDLTP